MTTFPYSMFVQEGETSGPCFSTYPHPPNTNASVTDRSETDSSSMVLDDPMETCMEKKRKNKDGSCLSSAQSQDKRGIKQRKCGSRKEETEKKKKKIHQEPPTEYIHVRARRGQATDSHSLAERVRREKISERMRLLQRLVPGCDKVTGKAPMLDEIINYVQSLQYQVEFLSMKLTSVNPVVHDFATDINAFMVKPAERMSGCSMGASSMQQQSNLRQPSAFADIIATSTTKNNYQDKALLPFLPQQGQPFSQEDNGNLECDVYDPRQIRLVANQYAFNNLCSFQ